MKNHDLKGVVGIITLGIGITRIEIVPHRCQIFLFKKKSDIILQKCLLFQSNALFY